MVEYNTIILGSGISGMSCAIYLKRAGFNTLIIENNAPGGQLNRVGVIENYPGYSSIMGPDLAMNVFEQVQSYQVDYAYGEVIHIDYEQKIVQMEDKQYHYQFLVFATGRRENKLDLDHEEELIGHGVSLCATCDGALYRNEEVVVVGGGNSAVSEAIYLAKICKKVTLIYRNVRLRAEDILIKRLKEVDNIEVIYQASIQSYLVQDGIARGVKLESGQEIGASCIFLAVGYLPNSELFDGVKENGYIVVDDHYQTSRMGIYACGDIIKKQLYQLITASNDGAMVASNIIQSQLK